jgi:hypothetical protein
VVSGLHPYGFKGGVVVHPTNAVWEIAIVVMNVSIGDFVMRRFGFMFALLGLLGLLGLVAAANPATAQEEPVFDLHPHMLLQRPEIGLINGVPHLVGVRSCVDLAGNQSVPLHAHHERVHFGATGVSFGGESGHIVVPTAPFPSPFADPLPWSNCDDFESLLPFSLAGE